MSDYQEAAERLRTKLNQLRVTDIASVVETRRDITTILDALSSLEAENRVLQGRIAALMADLERDARFHAAQLRDLGLRKLREIADDVGLEVIHIANGDMALVIPAALTGGETP